jgi:histidine kinase/DNA gyrase B/HSP90-like ATPase
VPSIGLQAANSGKEQRSMSDSSRGAAQVEVVQSTHALTEAAVHEIDQQNNFNPKPMERPHSERPVALGNDIDSNSQPRRWREEVPTIGTLELPPDARALDSMGRNHSFETALADLVDNSIDANATHVLIRLIRRGGRLRAVYVVDNGDGIPASTIDAAMTIGGRRKYTSSDLGHFGIGLKAASFGQARTLSVMSQASGDIAVGRRWELDPNRHGFHVDVVPQEFTEQELARDWGMRSTRVGTVIRWDNVIGFPITDDTKRVEEFIATKATSVSNHLGLVFHRILGSERVRIAFDVEDVDLEEAGPRFEVRALNPFGYRRTGQAGYPRELIARHRSTAITFRCHIWPGRSNIPEFRLSGGAEARQGLYIYRRDRLLQAGGDWGGVATPSKRLQLARAEIDIRDDIAGLFSMNPEKSRVLMGAEFTHLAETARAEDSTTFESYLAEAESAFRESRKRTRERRNMIPPGKGFTPALRRTMEDEIPLLEQDQALDIRWKRFDPSREDFLEIDRSTRTLWLNDRYRAALLGGRRGGLNDLPVVKALLYLLTEDAFQGEYLGAKDKDNIELWQEVLTAAVRDEKA